jgi:hypothetical protein
MSLEFVSLPVASIRTVPMMLAQPLTEFSLGVKGGRRAMPTTSSPSVSLLPIISHIGGILARHVPNVHVCLAYCIRLNILGCSAAEINHFCRFIMHLIFGYFMPLINRWKHRLYVIYFQALVL